jgi:16S rRNA (guanine966-N2)-methyltransferase
LLFLDPPYGAALVPAALAALRAAGWLAPGALILAELGREEAAPTPDPLAERAHGAARLVAWRDTLSPTPPASR